MEAPTSKAFGLATPYLWVAATAIGSAVAAIPGVAATFASDVGPEAHEPLHRSKVIPRPGPLASSSTRSSGLIMTPSEATTILMSSVETQHAGCMINTLGPSRAFETASQLRLRQLVEYPCHCRLHRLSLSCCHGHS